MNIESLKVTKSVKPEVSTSKNLSKSKDFTEVLTKTNSEVSKREKTIASKSDNFGKQATAKQKVDNSSTKELQSSADEVQGTNESEETKATSSRFKFNLSKGLEGLLGSVSKLADDTKDEQTINMDNLSDIINATSLQDLGSLLGLNLKQEDFAEGLSLDKILQTLDIDKDDFQKTLQQLTGDQSKGKDVWDLLAGIDQNQLAFIQNLMASIKGDASSKISKSQAAQILQFLKIVELAAPKTDLMLNQEYQSFQVKELISKISSKIEQDKVTNSDSQLTKINDIQHLNIKLADTSANENVSTIPTASKGATTVTLTLPIDRASQAEALVKEFQSMMNRSQFSNNAAGTKLLIKLYPENLGSIRVEIVQKEGIMTARFLASTNIGKQMLESQLQQLKQGLVNQNIQLDRIDVAQALNETNRHEKEHQQFQQAFRQHSNEQQKQKNDEEEEKSNFNDFLTELEA